MIVTSLFLHSCKSVSIQKGKNKRPEIFLVLILSTTPPLSLEKIPQYIILPSHFFYSFVRCPVTPTLCVSFLDWDKFLKQYMWRGWCVVM